MDALPVELLQKVFRYIPIKDVIRLESVSRKWFETIQSLFINTSQIEILWPRLRVISRASDTSFTVGNSLATCSITRLEGAIIWLDRRSCSNDIHRIAFKYVHLFCNTLFSTIEHIFPNVRVLDLEYVNLHLTNCDVVTFKCLDYLILKLICPIRSPRLIIAPKLKHLSLERPMVTTSENILSFITQFAGSLETLCFKDSYIDLDLLAESFGSVNHIKRLNLSCYLEDGTLAAIACAFVSLEVLVLRDNPKITSNGVDVLLKSNLLQKTLAYLDVSGCSSVGNGIYDSLSAWPDDVNVLVVNGFKTKITPEKQITMNNGRWKMYFDISISAENFYSFV